MQTDDGFSFCAQYTSRYTFRYMTLHPPMQYSIAMQNKNAAANLNAPIIGASQAPDFYEIRIAGILDPLWHDWLNGLNVSYCNAESPDAQTIVSGFIADQAALHGLLMNLRDSNLRLISVNPQQTKGEQS